MAALERQRIALQIHSATDFSRTYAFGEDRFLAFSPPFRSAES
jgi:hypothetical protein